MYRYVGCQQDGSSAEPAQQQAAVVGEWPQATSTAWSQPPAGLVTECTWRVCCQQLLGVCCVCVCCVCVVRVSRCGAAPGCCMSGPAGASSSVAMLCWDRSFITPAVWLDGFRHNHSCAPPCSSSLCVASCRMCGYVTSAGDSSGLWSWAIGNRPTAVGRYAVLPSAVLYSTV